MQTALLITVLVALTSLPHTAAGQTSGVNAFFRDGQTFLTWQEDSTIKGEAYRIYRSDKPITTQNLTDDSLIATILEGSSRFEEMWSKNGNNLLKHRLRKMRPKTAARVIPRLCIEDAGDDNKAEMLSENTGLLVWTIKEPAQKSYYAVTTIINGKEDRTVALTNVSGPVHEKKEPIGAVLYYRERSASKNDKNEKQYDRDWYIMYMDYTLWNHDYIGYAFPFAITLSAFKEGGKTPTIHLDGIGTMPVFSTRHSNYGAGDFRNHQREGNALSTWYFGYGTKVKNRESGMQVKQDITNYVQYRIMQTVLWARRKYRITDPRFQVSGMSMGASGALAYALNFPRFVTACWAHEGVTDYSNTLSNHLVNGKPVVMWKSSIWGNYGDPKLKNPVKNLAFGDPQLDWYLKFNGTPVFDYRKAARFLEENIAEDFPLIGASHGWQDGSIPAKNQAEPFEKYIKDSRHCFNYSIWTAGHNWGTAGGTGTPMGPYMRWDESRPGFSNVPSVTGFKYGKEDTTSHTYMYRAVWGVMEKPVKGNIIEETEDSWSLPIIHKARQGEEKDYFVDITPRNLQQMKVKQGDRFSYKITNLDGSDITINFSAFINGDKVKQGFTTSGKIVADEHNLLLIPNIPISKTGCILRVKRIKL
ncbi:MAG TPA: hypothetical protein ENJ08_19840 [Gammaproteobacteria bacterium]|nr:hypothetical protein [Gammaproteobacteria bacterium]